MPKKEKNSNQSNQRNPQPAPQTVPQSGTGAILSSDVQPILPPDSQPAPQSEPQPAPKRMIRLNPNYPGNINQIVEMKDNPCKILIDTLGPKGVLSEKINEDKTEYNANAIQNEEIPEGIDEEMVTAMLIGAMFRPDRLNEGLSGSTLHEDRIGFNQYYILSNIANGAVTGFTNFMPILTEARKEVKAALAECRKGNYGPAKEMINRFLDYTNKDYHSMKVASIMGDANASTYNAEHVIYLLAQRVMEKPPINAVCGQTSVDKVRMKVINKQFEALGNTGVIRKNLIENFTEISKDPKEKEDAVAELLFNEYIVGTSYQSINNRKKQIDAFQENILKKYGLKPINDPTVMEDPYTQITMENKQYTLVGSDLDRIMGKFSVSDLEALISEDDGIEKLKAIFMPKIKQSAAFKKIMTAKYPEEMRAALEENDNNIFRDNGSPDYLFNDSNLPNAAKKYNKAVDVEYKNSVKYCENEYNKIIVNYFSEKDPYSTYKLKGTTELDLRRNAENIYNMYKFVDNQNGFVWFGSPDQSYTELCNAMHALALQAKELGNPEKQLKATDIKKYNEALEKVENLAEKYITDNIDKEEAEESKVNAATEIRRALAVNKQSAEIIFKKQIYKDAKETGADKVLQVRDEYEKYAFRNTLKEDVYKGVNFRNTNITDGAAGYTLSRWGAASIATMALAATGKYTFEELVDDKLIVEEKQRMFEEVVKRGSFNTPENQKWIAENIYNGFKVVTDLIDEAAKGLDYNDPDFCFSPLAGKVEKLAYLKFDAWQEMSHCKKEITEIASKEDPAFADFLNFKEHISSQEGYSFRAEYKQFTNRVEGYYKGLDDSTFGNLVNAAFEFYKKKDFIHEHIKANPDKKFSELGDENTSKMAAVLCTYAMAEGGLNDIVKLQLEKYPEVEKFLMSKVVDGSLFEDVKVIPHYEEERPEFDGLQELAELLKTRDIEYIKEKLADKSYLKRNSIESRLAATREERIDFFKDKKTGKFRDVALLNNEQMEKAAKLFDDTFGMYLSKTGVKKYLEENPGASFVDLFKIGGKSIREYIGESAAENLIETGKFNYLKTLIVCYATDPAVELTYTDFERSAKSSTYEQKVKPVLDVEDRDLIMLQKPYMAELEYFKAYVKAQYSDIDTSTFNDAHWEQMYAHEFHLIAQEGLIPADRIISNESIRANVDPLNPMEEAFADIVTMFGAKQYYVKDWGGAIDGKTEIIYSNTEFLNNMKDADPGDLSNESFATLAYFVGHDPEVITAELQEIDENKMPHEEAVAYASSRWTTDIIASGVGKPRIRMGTSQLDKINQARLATEAKLKDLSAGNAQSLAGSVVKGIRQTINQLKNRTTFGDSAKDGAFLSHMLTELSEVLESEPKLQNAVFDILSPEEKKLVGAFIRMKKVMEDKDHALDRLQKAEKGEIELSQEDRVKCSEAIATFHRFNTLWEENYKDFAASEGYAQAAVKMMTDKRIALKAKDFTLDKIAENSMNIYTWNNIKIPDEFVDGLLNENLRMEYSEQLTSDLDEIKKIISERLNVYQQDIEYNTEIKGDYLNPKNTFDVYFESNRKLVDHEHCLNEYSKILANSLSDNQITNIINRYNELAKSKNWTSVTKRADYDINRIFSQLNPSRRMGEQTWAFYNIIFEEYEKAPAQLEGVLGQFKEVKSIGELTIDDCVEHPYAKKIEALKKKNITESTKAMLDEVNERLASRTEDAYHTINAYNDPAAAMDQISNKALIADTSNDPAKPEFPEDTKALILETVAKMKQHGILTGGSKAEQDVKVYAHKNLLEAKLNLKNAVNSGDISKIDDANTAYEIELNAMQDIFDFVKEKFGQRNMVPLNLDTLRNPDIPPEFSLDHHTDSIVNGIYVLAEHCDNIGVSLEDYLNDPLGVETKYCDEGIKANSFDNFTNDKMTFAESMQKAFELSEKEISNPSFITNMYGASLGNAVGRPYDTVALLTNDSSKLEQLYRQKSNLLKPMDKKMTEEIDFICSLYHASDRWDRLGADVKTSMMNGFKTAFLSGGPLKREHINAIVMDKKATVLKDGSTYKDALQVRNKYDDIAETYKKSIASVKGNSFAAKITSKVMTESMYDYLMAHPEDRNLESYKNLLKVAKSAPNSAEMYDNYKKWQTNFKKKANELSKAAKTADHEFDIEFKQLQKDYKRYRNMPLMSGNDQLEEVKDSMKAMIDSRISDLIDAYRYKEITETYLMERYKQLMQLKDNPMQKLPGLPKFVDESSPEKAAKDLELINSHVQDRAWEGHLSSLDKFAAWRVNHVTVLNAEGQAEVREEKNLDVKDLSYDEWELAYKNEIRRQKIDTPLPGGIIDPKAAEKKNPELKLNQDEKKKQEQNNQLMDDIVANGLTGGPVQTQKNQHHRMNIEGLIPYVRDNLRSELFNRSLVMDEMDDKTHMTNKEYLMNEISRMVVLDIVKRRGTVPNGLGLMEFQGMLKMDECFRSVTMPLLEAVQEEARTNPEKQELTMVDMVMEMIDQHILVNCAAMEQSAKKQRELLSPEGWKELKEKSAKGNTGDGIKGDTPEADNPGVNHIKDLIEKRKTAQAKAEQKAAHENEKKNGFKL